MPSKNDIEKSLNDISNWLTVSYKKVLLDRIHGKLSGSEIIIDIIEGMYTGNKVSKSDLGTSGILCLTDKRLFFVSSDKKINIHEEIPVSQMINFNFEKGFTSVKLIISTNTFKADFKCISKESSVNKFIEEFRSNFYGEVVKTENKKDVKEINITPEITKKGKTDTNIDFLFLEAKKICLVLNEYLKFDDSNLFIDFLIRDLLTIAGYCIKDKDISDKEKFFLILVLVHTLPNIKNLDKEKIKKMFNTDFFEGEITDVIKNHWYQIENQVKKNALDLSDYTFMSLEYLKAEDKALGTTHYDRLRTIYFNFSQCIVKADGKVTIDDEKKIKKICSLIYCKNPVGEKNKAQKINLKKIKNENNKTYKKAETEEEELDLDTVLVDINKLVGMKKIKDQINTLINLIKVQQAREERGLPLQKISLHSVFYGPPGTGKTTIARLLGKVYKCLGLLEKGHLIETDRAGVVAGYVGQTAIKVDEIVNKALDGILFIDEAYTLKPRDGGKDFGQEAIDIILKRMEDYRDRLVIIVAGYPDEMKAFINSNPGLKSRFNRYFYFDHFKPEELIKIFDIFAGNVEYKVDKKARKKVLELLTYFYALRDKRFGNGRLARNIFEKIIERQANRIAAVSPLTDEVLCTITENDIPVKEDIVS